MEKKIRSSIKYTITARDIWLDLEERFVKENAPRAYKLQRTVTTIPQENMTVSACYTKLRGVWFEILSISSTPTCTCNGCTCGLAKKISKMGINEEYGAVKTQILSNNPLPILGVA
ncbi:uncharacterized protein LOC112505939 [Cynara cardunculus var. scolymus]|uniref:uncharacterized protein LOC112505939 n=1 Tax=Cynara cardunculus var. scolymus TaxID=59895 RepID=UPI000D630313|nr:uncharacterized protein LOC112505939 [Cynara cardunculus var. scolymus]